MTDTIKIERFDDLMTYWQNDRNRLKWECLFTLPWWLRAWWDAFHDQTRPCLCSVWHHGELLGLAPLQIDDECASFIGSADVCDYLDFIPVPGREGAFFGALIDELARRGVLAYDLRCLRPESSVLTHMKAAVCLRGGQVDCQPEDVSMELDLPSSWADYLKTLNGKQRHEVRRKLRRLDETAEVHYTVIQGVPAHAETMDLFLDLFRNSRDDKDHFMTNRMESFFRSMAASLGGQDILKFGLLELDQNPAAVVMYFDYHDTFYLYNNGYDPRYQSLGVGNICKILNLQDGINRGKKKYDFMKGTEPYKYRLGGREVPLQRCRMRLNPS